MRSIILALTLFCTATAIAQEKPTWDVSTPFGPTETISFETDEGTWMSLDVSPDGETIVFDLMGDLYTMPVAGGTATPITSGPAWDVQPAFSPDGSRIAFTSDRAGGDNIWTVAADGSDAKQVTKETFRLLNGPAWTPDGEYILARKHFTSDRSLGAGEVWMYHASGQAAAGLQLTKQKNDQQDQGNEIAVSPDGRYVYFSEDVSGGSTFQYNKDPNGQIYAIRRLDRETGRLENYITGNGGSARATPSPDGKTIAFVRRVRSKSVIFLFDAATGRQWPVYDGLNRDQQEAWAIFGVYPSMSWTPDGGSLLFWAGGKINKLDVAAGSVTEIPFTATVERTIHEAHRVSTPVHTETFEARMIRDVATSPDGRTMVFHAAGYLYRKTLPDGVPSRLTRQADHWEYDPSFSPDGKHIVYTTWDDVEYATIRTVPVAGGASRLLETPPGHYESPRYSPDGKQIVFGRRGANSLTGRLHGMDTGIYRMALAGGEPVLVSRSGGDARFGPEGKRIYFLAGGGYRSVDLTGGDARTHFEMKYANTVVPSPDFEWVAFNELFNAYVAPFPKTGGAIDLNKDTKAIPVKQVTRDLGTDLHWSADSKRLHWMVGPEYFTRSLAESFTFVDGSPDELPAIDSTGTAVGLVLPSDAPTGVTAITGARIVTMAGDQVIPSGTVLIQDNRIVAIGSEVSIPDGATVVDASGKTVLPGFVDAHAHLNHFFGGPIPEESWVYSANLAFGVTTAHDPSAVTETVFTLSEMVRAGRLTGPRIYSTGTILYGADGNIKAVINSLDDARSHLRRMKAVGAISVKSYNQPRREQRQQVMQAARELGMLVVPEGGSTFNHNMTMIIDGHTGIEHNVPVAPLYRDVLETWRHSGTGYTPTLVVVYGGPSGERYFYEHDEVWANERLTRYVPSSDVDALARRRYKSVDDEYYHDEVAAQAKKLVDQGNLVQVGAHGQMQGLAFHWEMRMLTQGGFTPHEALRSATLHGAQYLGLDGDIGSLEVGKLADLIIVDGDPLARIEDAENVDKVMVNGRMYDAMNLPRGATAGSW